MRNSRNLATAVRGTHHILAGRYRYQDGGSRGLPTGIGPKPLQSSTISDGANRTGEPIPTGSVACPEAGNRRVPEQVGVGCCIDAAAGPDNRPQVPESSETAAGNHRHHLHLPRSAVPGNHGCLS